MVKKSIEHILYERKYCLYSWYTRHQHRSIEEIRKSCVSTCIKRVSVSRIFNTYRNLYLTCIHIGRLCIYLSNKCFCEPFLQLKNIQNVQPFWFAPNTEFKYFIGNSDWFTIVTWLFNFHPRSRSKLKEFKAYTRKYNTCNIDIK